MSVAPIYRWFRSLHYGGTHVVLWWRVAPDGGLHVASELTQDGGLISELCLAMRQKTRWMNLPAIDYTAALEEQIIGKIKKSDEGETREQTFRNHGIVLRPATHDPVQGWTRIQELLGSRPDGRPYLTIGPNCERLVRALTNAVRDPNDPESVLESANDGPLRALRIGAMSRPAPRPNAPVSLPPNAIGRLADQLRRDSTIA